MVSGLQDCMTVRIMSIAHECRVFVSATVSELVMSPCGCSARAMSISRLLCYRAMTRSTKYTCLRVMPPLCVPMLHVRSLVTTRQVYTNNPVVQTDRKDRFCSLRVFRTDRGVTRYSLNFIYSNLFATTNRPCNDISYLVNTQNTSDWRLIRRNWKHLGFCNRPCLIIFGMIIYTLNVLSPGVGTATLRRTRDLIFELLRLSRSGSTFTIGNWIHG